MKIFFLFFPVLLAFNTVLANGGPVDGSAITGTGQIKLISKANISLDEEFLFISFEDDYADVSVKYLLTNHGESENITYAFPVNVMDEKDDYFPYFSYDECIPYFNMLLDNIALDSIQVKLDSMENGYIGEDGSRFYNYTKWYIGVMPVKKDSQHEIKINYKVKMDFTDMQFSKSSFTYFDYRKFFYDFSPASHWGNGKVDKLQIVINSTDVIFSGDSVAVFKVPGNPAFSEVCQVNLSDCDMSSIKPIQIEIISTNSKRTKEYINSKISLRERDYLARMKFGKIIKNVICSSRNDTNELYQEWAESASIQNLFDNYLNTAWYETAKGNGIGEALTISFSPEQGYVLKWLGIINGYTKSRETFYNNSRIKKLKIEELDSANNTYPGYPGYTIDLPDRKYEDLKMNAWGNFVDVLMDAPEGGKKPAKIRLTVIDVYPGIKYKDLCISELLIGTSIWQTEY